MRKFMSIACALFTVVMSEKTEPGKSITKSNWNEAYTPGELIFADEFDTLDCEIWRHEITHGGNDRWEFQTNHNSRQTSFTRDGKLFIKPRLTVDDGINIYGSEVDMNGGAPAEPCTDASFYGCWRRGGYPNILNPISSAHLTTVRSFYFQYGRVEVRAKLPGGEWMWPAIRLMPRFHKYGAWPASGQIDIMESRGNRKLFDTDGTNVGSEMVSVGLSFGPAAENAKVIALHATSPPDQGFDRDFHTFELEWTDRHLIFKVDNRTKGAITPSDKGFWEMLGIKEDKENPWVDSDTTRMAPFDCKFYLVVNVAIGGVSTYFGEHLVNGNGKKPWSNWSGRGALQFWEGRDQWFPSWQGDNGTLQVDYIRIYAV